MKTSNETNEVVLVDYPYPLGMYLYLAPVFNPQAALKQCVEMQNTNHGFGGVGRDSVIC